MSAKCPDELTLKELMKYTGYECECGERAVCCMSHKLYCWGEKDKDNNYLFTLTDRPKTGDFWVYSASPEGLLGAMHFDSKWIFEGDSMTYQGVTFERIDLLDVDL